jgi:hypothetical protein
MALLGSFFIGHVFAPVLPSGQISSYIAGLILLAAAPCTVMVFVWSNLCDGEPHYTLSQVALNDVIMVFLFAPLMGLLLGVASITVPWEYDRTATNFSAMVAYAEARVRENKNPNRKPYGTCYYNCFSFAEAVAAHGRTGISGFVKNLMSRVDFVPDVPDHDIRIRYYRAVRPEIRRVTAPC